MMFGCDLRLELVLTLLFYTSYARSGELQSVSSRTVAVESVCTLVHGKPLSIKSASVHDVTLHYNLLSQIRGSGCFRSLCVTRITIKWPE